MNIYYFSTVTFYSILSTGIANTRVSYSLQIGPHFGPVGTNCAK